MSKLTHCVYVLFSLKDKNFYIGSSSNLKSRLTDHFNGEVKSTLFRRPFKLIFCEYFLSKKDSLRREKYFKTTSGKKALKLIIRKSLDELMPKLVSRNANSV
ncbi:MAG: GIY-YIG nuclease family protein [Patescibacteria group bacterium]|nr:GIY-YIG nuclease family protein [Patescibacteria group bacterium]